MKGGRAVILEPSERVALVFLNLDLAKNLSNRIVDDQVGLAVGGGLGLVYQNDFVSIKVIY